MIREAPAFGYHRIAALLPHRYPFQFVDRVLEFEDGKRIAGAEERLDQRAVLPRPFSRPAA